MTDKHLSTQFDTELSAHLARACWRWAAWSSRRSRRRSTRSTQFSGEAADRRCWRPRSASTRWRSRSTASCRTDHRPAPADRARPAPADRDLQDDRQPGARRRRGRQDRAHGRSDSSNSGVSSRVRLPSTDLRIAAELASRQLRKALDAFARLDVERGASRCSKDDDLIDQEFDGLVRKLITYMMEDPRTISASLDLRVRRQGDRAHRRPREEHRRGRSSTSSRAPTCGTTRSDGRDRWSR